MATRVVLNPRLENLEAEMRSWLEERVDSHVPWVRVLKKVIISRRLPTLTPPDIRQWVTVQDATTLLISDFSAVYLGKLTVIHLSRLGKPTDFNEYQGPQSIVE